METLAIRIADESAAVRKLEPWLKDAFENLTMRCGSGIATQRERDAFFAGVVRLISQLANPFWKKHPNWYSMDDLIQLCFARVWETLGQYNPEKGAVSTWVHYVTFSVLCKEYNSSKLDKKRFFTTDDKHDEECSTRGLEKFASFTEDSMLKIRMRDAITSLFEKNKDKNDILIEIFGNPDNDNYEPPFDIPLMTVVSRALEPKYKYTEVYGFYKETIQPFFKNVFSDYMN